jgi:hypothetical protein
MDVSSSPLALNTTLESHLMTTLVEKLNAAGNRYKAALVELRAAFVDLSALDRLLSAPFVWSAARYRAVPTSYICAGNQREFPRRYSGANRGTRAVIRSGTCLSVLYSTGRAASFARMTCGRFTNTFLSKTPKGVGLRGKVNS